MIRVAAAVCSGAIVSVGGPACASAVRPPAPVFARTVVLAPVGGQVLIDVPGGQNRFVRLTAPRAVPVGTTVDTTHGTVGLTSANPGAASVPAEQSGRFFRGIFRVQQSRTAGGLVDLVIRDNLPGSACQAGAARAAAPTAARAAALSQLVLGLLRGTAKGHFRTIGRFAAATVRGTDWGVRDRCDGTLTVVRRGVVIVRDFRLHKNVTVSAGQTYLAKAP